VSGPQDQLESVKRNFTSAPPASPVVSCPKGALTQQQAQARFDKFKAREDIPWNYPNDCCYNRAHVMAEKLQAEGVDVGKVWNYAPSPNIGNLLRVSTMNDPKGYVEWGYHVAPTIPVMNSQGRMSRMVLDPSIANTPITPDQWKALQGQPTSNLVATDASPYYRDQKGKCYGGLDPTNRNRQPTPQEVEKIFDRHRRARALNWIGKE
jgi:hypothetical protein